MACATCFVLLLAGVTWLRVSGAGGTNNGTMVALGHTADRCAVTVEQLARNLPAGFYSPASPDQISKVQSGQLVNLDVGATCPGAP
jgi:hypothetical protein